MKVTVTIWDWPLRVFHWLLVIAVVGAYATGKLGGNLTDWHGRLGCLVLGLLVFRLIWGFQGIIGLVESSDKPPSDKLIKWFLSLIFSKPRQHLIEFFNSLAMSFE